MRLVETIIESFLFFEENSKLFRRREKGKM